MTLMELQDILGDRIKTLTDDNLSAEQREIELNTSTVVCSLAKQMINNADVILRADKLITENKTNNTHIQTLMGD